jgi:hypothetical protein
MFSTFVFVQKITEVLSQIDIPFSYTYCQQLVISTRAILLYTLDYFYGSGNRLLL